MKPAKDLASKPEPGAIEIDLTGRDFVLVMLHREDGKFKAVTVMDILHRNRNVEPKGRRNDKFLNSNVLEIQLNFLEV